VYQQDKMVNPLIEQVKDAVVQIAMEEMNRWDELEQPS